MKKLLFLVLFLICSSPMFSQSYGNEWISPNQKYFKITLNNTGIYRIDYFNLINAATEMRLDLSTVNPRKWQIFHNGVEIPIYVAGEQDNIFNSSDFIEFYSTPNDGKLDNGLYSNSDFNANPSRSIISDSSVFYLTFLPANSPQNGLRLKEYRNTNFNSLTPQNYCLFTSKVGFYNLYNYGKGFSLQGSQTVNPEYVKAEGFVGSYFGSGTSIPAFPATVPTPNASLDGPNPQLSFQSIGANDNVLVSNDHHLKVNISNDNVSYTTVFDTLFDGITVIKKELEFSKNQIGNETYFRFTPEFITGVPYQAHALAYINIKYSRTLDLTSNHQRNFELEGSTSPRYLEWTNYNASKNRPIIYDLTSGYRVRGEKYGSDNVRIILPSGNTSNYYLTDSTDITFLTANQIKPGISYESIDDNSFVVFDSRQWVNKNKFLMITNNTLVGKYTGDFIQYKRTITNTSPADLVTVQQLYDHFSYGVPHPLAIRNFLRFLAESGDTTLKFVFLVGRGYQTDYIRPANRLRDNIVPSIGVPASDNMFATSILGSNLSPYFAIGRLTIDRAVQLGIYLNKVKDFDANSNEIWKKHNLHLAGGEDGSQAINFTNRLNSHANFVKAQPFGGWVTTYTKSSVGISEPFLKQKAIDVVCKPEGNGVQFVTFLGHGSANVADVDIGDTLEYYNKNKYPIFYFNGCSIGNPCIGPPNKNVRLSGERFINAKDKGAIAFIGQTALSELNHVDRQNRELYRLIYSSKYNGNYTIGEAIKDMLGVTGIISNELNSIQSRILFLQGDPSLRLYQPSIPDYEISDKSVFLYPEDYSAVADSFAVAVPITNKGKYVSDSISIRIDRSYPNNFIEKTYFFKVKSIANTDTVYLYIKSKDAASAGINKFTITINDDFAITENNYTNNRAIIYPFIPGNGVNLIYPKRYDIVSRLNNDSVTLVAQALNIFEQNYQFVFEIDTSHLFNSPWKKADSSSSIIGHLRNWKVKLMGNRDSIVYYWRARINTGSIQGGLWTERSFIHILDNEAGWSQSHFPQFYPTSSLFRVALNQDLRKFEFSPTSEKVFVTTAYTKFPNFGIKKGGYASTSLNPGTSNGMIAILFDKNSLEQFQLNKIFNTGKYWGIYYYEEALKAYNLGITTLASQDLFNEFVDSIPEGTYIAMCNVDNVRRSQWTEATKASFRKLGSKLVDSFYSDRSSFAMIGKKGAPPGWATEDTGHYFSSALDLSLIEIEKEMIGKRNKGSISSELIGPTSEWGALHFWTKNEEPISQDLFNIEIHGISKSNNDTILFSNITSSPFDLSSIDASQFPSIYLKANFEDTKDYTPPQLMHWRVTNKEVPEGTLNPTLTSNVWRDTLNQGEAFNYEIAFQNISKLSFNKNLQYEVTIFNIDSKDTVFKSVRLYNDSLKPNQFFKIGASLNTKKLKGRYAYSVKVNFDIFNKPLQPELTMTNNSAVRYFYVEEDRINPLLDVTFDGRHIANGEIVSANPIITISSKDENKLNWQTDTAGIIIWMKKPNETDFRLIDFDSFGVKYFPATSAYNQAKAIFSPQNLEDGIYTLKIQSRDANGTAAGTSEYLINFVVINQASTTNFYPYPNPFTTQMKFVFTLTGKEIPDYINIKIMTIQGKVIKELNKDDLGDIRIGNNITDVVWDGTDTYGDRLSNGVYLYTLTIKTNGEELSQLENDNLSNQLNADKANNKLFKHSVGKIVLLR